MKHEAPVAGTKVCRGECEMELHALAFAVDPHAADGLRAKCRECESKYQLGYRAKRHRSHRNEVLDLD